MRIRNALQGITFSTKRSILFFSLIMLVKSYFAWYYLFEDGPTWTTWLKEIPFVLLLFCLIEWFATKHKVAIYLIVNLLITVLFFSLIVYHNHFGMIATSQVFGQVKQVGAVKKVYSPSCIRNICLSS